MSNKNNTSNSKMAVPEAKEAMDKFKMEIANELGVPLTNGYNGNLTSYQNGSVGGYMVKKMIEEQEKMQSFMYLSFPVMNVRKPLFRAGSRRSSTTAINTKTLLPYRHPCGCSMRQASIIINTTARSGRSQYGCRCG